MWQPEGTAPNESAERLARFLDENLARLSVYLEETKPIFPVWAEENAALTATTYQWAFGNGANTPSGSGLVLPFRADLFGMTLMLTGATSRAEVQIEKDGVLQSGYTINLVNSNIGTVDFFRPLEFSRGSVLNFYTVSQSNTVGPNVVTAWFRKQ